VRPAAGVLLLCIAVGVFALFAADLLWKGPVTTADAGISTWFHGRMHPAMTQMLLAVTQLHSTLGIGLMAAAAAALLAWRRQGAWLAPLVLAVPGGLLLNSLVKQAFQRARPHFDDAAATLASYSFPSGHTSGATVWWGFLLVLWFASDARGGPRAVAAAVAVVMVLLTAISRVYLGFHYASDVLAAIAEGTAWLVLCFMVTGALGRSAQERAA
jgi:undecaprenyl-diphosphatase